MFTFYEKVKKENNRPYKQVNIPRHSSNKELEKFQIAVTLQRMPRTALQPPQEHNVKE